MLKVFLVEDELVIRNAIKGSVAWEEEGYEFVGEAQDGEIAYPMIQRLQPDIVITDIKMPFMDGLELSRLVRKNFPHIKIIILSGYDDFSYAQQAVSLGISAYLLKPIRGKKLLDELSFVADKIYRERENSVEYCWQRIKEEKVEKQEFFSKLVGGGKLTFCEIMKWSKKYNMDFIAPYFQIMHLTLMDGTREGTGENLGLCCEEVSRYLEQVPQVRTFEMGVEGWYLILLKESSNIYGEPIHTLKTGIQRIVSSYEGVNWFAGVGCVVERIQRLSESYKMASKTSAARFFLEKNQLLSYEEAEGILAKKDIDISADEIQTDSYVSLRSFLRKGFQEEIEEFVDNYLKTMGESNLKSLLFRQYVVMNSYFSIHSFLKEIEADTEEDFQEVIANSVTLESVQKYLCRHLTSAIEARDRRGADQHKDLMNEILPYIRKHHREDSLSLNRVAEVVHVSPSYLSKIFSEEMGCGFIEYLTTLRIESAKELLLCTDSKVTNIAFEVGYRDSGYFCQLFKKNVGCTMKEYRANALKENPITEK